MSKPTQQTKANGKPELPQRWHDPENNTPSATELRQAAAGHEIDQESEQLNGEILIALEPLTLLASQDDQLEKAVANLRQLIRDARLIGYEDGQRVACNIRGRLTVISEHLKRAVNEVDSLTQRV